MELLFPLAVFAGFVFVFLLQARREGTSLRQWNRDRNAATTYVPGGWKPAAVGLALLIVFFIVYVTLDQGWRWAYLLVIPLLGGSFALAACGLSWFFKRTFPRR